MGKDSMKENENVYFVARKKAALYNDKLYSREGASELLGISVSTLADYELGNTKVVPVDKVVLMADLYRDPSLITGYCMRECPVHGFLPLATEERNIQGIALRILSSFDIDQMEEMRRSLIEITKDGQIIKSTMTNEKEIEVPNTGVNAIDITYVLGGLAILGGIGAIIYEKKKNKK